MSTDNPKIPEGDTVAVPLAIKSCLECRFCGFTPSADRKCLRTVSEHDYDALPFCRDERSVNDPRRCGFEGRFFAPAPVRRAPMDWYDRKPLPPPVQLPVAIPVAHHPLGPRGARYIRPISWNPPSREPIPVFYRPNWWPTPEEWTLIWVSLGILTAIVGYSIFQYYHPPRFY